MSADISLLASIVIFVLALLVGVEVIGKVPATLHTPLMSGANSIHGIVLIGGMIIAADRDRCVRLHRWPPSPSSSAP